MNRMPDGKKYRIESYNGPKNMEGHEAFIKSKFEFINN
jgi:hypothetical protein